MSTATVKIALETVTLVPIQLPSVRLVSSTQFLAPTISASVSPGSKSTTTATATPSPATLLAPPVPDLQQTNAPPASLLPLSTKGSADAPTATL